MLRKEIIKQFPEQHERYIEVFGGAGWVLFGKEPSKMEVYNDANGELVNLYRCVKYHFEALQKELDGMLMSRELFLDFKQKVRGLTDIQRAARFYVLIKESYGSDCSSFGVRSKNMAKATEFLKTASERLQNVVIEHADFARVLKIYDRPGALFYLDPPYFKTEKYYETEFKETDHLRLKESLDRLKGKFILSYNDCDEIRELYHEYKMIEVERMNNLRAKTNGGTYKELLIKNF